MEPETTIKTDFWTRVRWVWSLILYAALLFSLVAVLLKNDVTPTQKWQIGMVALIFALWHAGFVTYISRQGENPHDPDHHFQAVVYVIGLIILWAVLTILHPLFNFVLFGMYAQVFGYMRPKWSIPISLGFTALITYLQIRDSDTSTLSFDSPWLAYILISGAAGIVLVLFISGIISQSAERRELIEQLQTTRSELAAAERREGILQERERLAREIHDTLAQGFIGIITHLEASEQNLPEDPEQSRHHLLQAKEMARRGVNQARRVVQDLRPEVLEKAPLPQAIERVVQAWATQSGVQAQTTITGTHTHLHPEAETTLIRAVQEALTNVQKHAQASSVQVTLSYMGDLLMLDVQDDGVGLDNALPPSDGGGYGLTAMRQRVTQVGGALTVESEPGEGTTVVVQIPISRITQEEPHETNSRASG